MCVCVCIYIYIYIMNSLCCTAETNTILSINYTLIKLVFKNTQIRNAGEGAEKREPCYTVGGNVNWCCHYGEEHAVCEVASVKSDSLRPHGL